jgi:hypothetical protein
MEAHQSRRYIYAEPGSSPDRAKASRSKSLASDLKHTIHAGCMDMDRNCMAKIGK